MKKKYDDGKVVIRWDEDVKTETTNFWELFKLQLHLSATSISFGFCLMLFIGFTTSTLLRDDCSWVAEKTYEDWNLQKSDFYVCAMNHWVSLLVYRPLNNFWFFLFLWVVWERYIFRTTTDLTMLLVGAVSVIFHATFTYFTPAEIIEHGSVGNSSRYDNQYTEVSNFLSAASVISFLILGLYLICRRCVKKGSSLVAIVVIGCEMAGHFVYSSALESLLNKGKRADPLSIFALFAGFRAPPSLLPMT